jgi:hypothetical protein
MTAAAARTETSGKAKSGLSASSKAAAARSAAAKNIVSRTESGNEETKSVEQAETIAAQHESIAAEPVAAPEPSVAVQPESVSEPAEAATMSSNVATMAPNNIAAAEPNTGAASPQTSSAPWDLRDEKPRFRIFVIDSGWNHPASKVLQDNFDLIHALTHEDPIYVLDQEKSIALLRQNKGLIGHDPIVAVHDISASGVRKHLGFRLHLGLLDDEAQCMSSLKMFARFINTHRDAKDLEADVRRKLHKQGMAGAIEIVGGAAHHVLMEA